MLFNETRLTEMGNELVEQYLRNDLLINLGFPEKSLLKKMDVEVTFKFKMMYRLYGVARVQREKERVIATITMSIPFIMENKEEIVTYILKHEIAHIRTHSGHGPVFIATCHAMGVPREFCGRTQRSDAIVRLYNPRAFRYKCENGHEIIRVRRVNNITGKICSRCKTSLHEVVADGRAQTISS